MTVHRFCFNGVLEKTHKIHKGDTKGHVKKASQTQTPEHAETAEMSATQQHRIKSVVLSVYTHHFSVPHSDPHDDPIDDFEK